MTAANTSRGRRIFWLLWAELRGGFPRFTRAVGSGLWIGLSIGGLIFAAFFALAAYTTTQTPDAGRQQITAAFAHGALDPKAGWLLWDVRRGAHQTNDCLILFQAVDDRAPPLQRAVSPLSVPNGTKFSCAALQRLAVGEPAPETRFYHHYLHGQTVLTRLLLPALGVEGLRGTYRLILSLALLAGIALPAVALTKGRPLVPNLIWLICFAVFARYFGFESFGQSIGHAPSDMVLLGFLLAMVAGTSTNGMSGRRAVVIAAVFGAFTLQFELLSGGLPLGVAMVLGCIPLALRHDARLPRVTLTALVAFAAAICAGVVGKLAALALVFGTGPITDAAQQLLFRAGVGMDNVPDAPANAYLFYTRIWAGMEGMAAGMHWLAVGTLALALTLGIWAYFELRRAACPANRFRAAALAGSILVIPLWMVVMWQHSAQHSWFMDRIWAWPIAAGFSLFTLALIEQRRADR